MINTGYNFMGMARAFLLAFVFCFASPVLAQQVLKPEQAFPVTVSYQADNIVISHEIKQGYYLYKDKISYASTSQNIQLSQAELPAGKAHVDEFFGSTEIYRDSMIVKIPVNIVEKDLVGNNFIIEIKLQGCADIGLCYPPQTWQREVFMDQSDLNKVNPINITSESEQYRLGNLISDGNIFLVFITFLGLGFLLAFT
ncbi:MAG TPA: hypothetical protein EYO10_00190, partial [Gammaproteobacteria bacterium]|nr:hypothetical protein [Gammaproteobacteria bacterium]